MENHNGLSVFRYEDSEESVTNQIKPTIFLAGPTVRGNQPHLTSWRFAAMWNAIHGELGKQGDIFRTLDDTISASIIKANTIHLIKQNSIL